MNIPEKNYLNYAYIKIIIIVIIPKKKIFFNDYLQNISTLIFLKQLNTGKFPINIIYYSRCIN